MVRTTVWAPPSLAGFGAWGPWTSLLSYIGTGCYRISYSEIGDVLAKGRVRYTDYHTRKTVIKEFLESIDIHTADVYGIIKVSFISFTTGVSVEVILQAIDCEHIQKPIVPEEEKCSVVRGGTREAITYCVNIGLSDKGIPINTKVTRLNPLVKPIWKSIKIKLLSINVWYSKTGKRLIIKARVKIELERYKSEYKEISNNKVEITVRPEVSEWSLFEDPILVTLENVNLPLEHGSKRYNINSLLTYNGIEIDKKTSFTVNKNW